MTMISILPAGGTTEENLNYTGSAREITIDTTLWQLRVHDGVTPGGLVQGGIDTLASCQDVTISSPAGGQLLAYNATAGKWENFTPSPTVAWSNVEGTPTSLAGYGITNGVTNTTTVSAGSGLTGGGALSGNVSLALASIAGQTLVGNSSSSAATPAALTVAQILTLLALDAGDIAGLAASATTDTTNAGNISSGTLPAARLPALTGAVTTTAGSTATTLAASVVGLSNMAALAASSIMGNASTSAAAPAALSASQVKSLLAITTSDVSGMASYATVASLSAYATTSELTGYLNLASTTAVSVEAATVTFAGAIAFTSQGQVIQGTNGSGIYLNYSGDGYAYHDSQDGYYFRIGEVAKLQVTTNGVVSSTGSYYGQSGLMISDAADGWLRFNQSGAYTSGMYTPGSLRVDGTLSFNTLLNSDGVGGGRTAISDLNDGWLRLNNNGAFSNGLYTPNNLEVSAWIRTGEGMSDIKATCLLQPVPNVGIYPYGTYALLGGVGSYNGLVLEDGGGMRPTFMASGNNTGVYNQSAGYWSWNDNRTQFQVQNPISDASGHAYLRHTAHNSGVITFSTAAPSGGSDGDIWFQY